SSPVRTATQGTGSVVWSGAEEIAAAAVTRGFAGRVAMLERRTATQGAIDGRLGLSEERTQALPLAPFGTTAGRTVAGTGTLGTAQTVARSGFYGSSESRQYSPLALRK